MAFLSYLAAALGGPVTSPRPDWLNLAAGKPVQFHTPPNYPDTSDADDARQLVDGHLADKVPMWYDRNTVGWAGEEPAAFTVDLGRVEPIRGVALRMGAGQAGAEWPSSIQIYVSHDGKQFSLVGDLMQLLAKRPPEKGYAAFWLVADKLETHGRFVKFAATPLNLGNGAYLFMDEIEIYRGDDAWLERPLSAMDAPEHWRAAWESIPWRELTDSIPAAERPTRLRLVDGRIESGGETPWQQVTVEKDAVRFTLNGEASKLRSMAWMGKLPQPVSAENCRYAVLTFRAEGIRRGFDARPLVTLQGVGSTVTLLEANQALNDGWRHTVVKPLPAAFTLQQLKVALVTEDDAPRLTLERLELVREPPAVFHTEIAAGASPPKDGFVPVELGALLNGTLAGWFEKVLAKHQTAMDGARELPAGWVTVSGVPFLLAGPEKNLALMPESAPATGTLEFLGAQVERRFLEPQSRHDTLSVPVDAHAREAFLLLALRAPPVQVRGGLWPGPLRLDDIESLSVELVYEDGLKELAFPYSLADKGCSIPARMLGAYAVAVDPARRLKRITLHNRHFGPSFALAAVTLNTTETALLPDLATISAPQPSRHNPDPAARPASVTRRDTRLIFQSRWFECDLDLAQGFVLARFVHRGNESVPVRLAPHAGLRVRVGDTLYTGRCFASEVVRTTPTTAELKLTSTRPELPLEIHVTIAVPDSPELSFAARTINRGDQPLAAELCLPALDGLAIGELMETRLFFPQYRAVDTGAPIALRAPYGPEFPSQFLDVYNRAAGIGLMVRTDNPEQRMADFTLRKDETGVSGGVWFPAPYNQLAPGASRDHPPVSLIAHGGDWRAAFELYRDWVRRWYKPVKAQDKDWFLNAWEIACYRTSEVVSWADSKVPPFITADRKRFLTEEVFAFEKEQHGHLPDIVHFFNWTHNDARKRNEYGVYSTPLAYAQVGGLEFFRQGVAEIQERWQRPVSLYTLSDRLRLSALPDPALARELAGHAAHAEMDHDASAALRASGAADGIIYPLIGHDRWIDFFVSDIAKMQRDTGCKLVYMDVFPYFSHLRGFGGISPREADRKVVQRMREALPAEVVLWTEYPLTDVASQWADGALHYYFLGLHQVFARPYNRSDRADGLFTELPLNLQRYVLPRYKTFGLPVYIEQGNKPSQVDAVFVNGEGFQEDTWRLHHSRIRARLNRAWELKHQYSDCFNSDQPSPQVDTAAAGLVANRFPGKNRNLWTLYNGRPKTYSGIVLKVPHVANAKYRDAWNDVALDPVIENGRAPIVLTLDPQQPGCIVQEWP